MINTRLWRNNGDAFKFISSNHDIPTSIVASEYMLTELCNRGRDSRRKTERKIMKRGCNAYATYRGRERKCAPTFS